jgi:hypothetical protein
MSRVRDIANILSTNTSMATDAEITSATAYIPSNVAGKNFIINGAFDFWQRGTTYSMTAGWSYGAADRWGMQQYPTGGACSVTRSTDVPTGAQYSIKTQRTASSTNTSSMGILQCIESMNAILLRGQTVTLSFYAKAGANFSGGTLNAKIQTGTAADETLGMANGSYTGNIVAGNTSPSITTTWTRYTLTTTLASNIQEISININWAGSGTAGADDSVYVSNVQLETGSVATPFSRAGGDIQGELAKCQRYYYRAGGEFSYPRLNSTTNYPFFGTAIATSSTNAIGVVPLPVPMRVYPTSIDLLSAVSYRLLTGNANYTVSGISLDTTYVFASSTTVTIGMSTSGLTTNNFYYVVGNFAPTAYIGFSAEL